MEGSEETKEYEADYPIRDEDVEQGFKYEVAEQEGGEGLLRCLKCGACSGGCPVAAVTDYRPRLILGDVLLGLKEHVLTSDAIWECAACFTCEERCVQEVGFTDVVTILRNMATRNGDGSPGYIELAKRVQEHGRVSPLLGTVAKMRTKLGLPPAREPDVDQLTRIWRASGFNEILEANEGRSEVE